MSTRKSVSVGALILGAGLLAAATARPQQVPTDPPPDALRQRLAALEQSLAFAEQALARKADELLLFRRLEDLAVVDRVRYTGPPPRVVKNPTAPGAKNPVIVPAYTFLPRKYLAAKKLPLLVFVHGGVHG